MNVTKPPTTIPLRVFLAGSIEMGTAKDWQTDVGQALVEKGFDVLNPRRENWDSSWEQRASNPNFKQQVDWELQGLEIADAILMFFDPDTKSPISLLELGLFADSKKLIVACPDGYWKKGNVEIICSKYRIPLFDNLYDALHSYWFQSPEYLSKIEENSLYAVRQV